MKIDLNKSKVPIIIFNKKLEEFKGKYYFLKGCEQIKL